MEPNLLVSIVSLIGVLALGGLQYRARRASAARDNATAQATLIGPYREEVRILRAELSALRVDVDALKVHLGNSHRLIRDLYEYGRRSDARFESAGIEPPLVLPEIADYEPLGRAFR